MALVKGDDASAAVREAIVLDLSDLRRQARAIIEQAEGERDRILAKARVERRRLIESAAEEGARLGVEEGRRIGREAGRRAGHQAALEDGRKRVTQLDSTWTEALDAFIRQRDETLRAARSDVLRLAVRIAERILRRSIAIDPGSVSALVESALALVLEPTALRVHVHPDDLPVIRGVLPEACRKLSAIPDLQLVEDASLQPGALVVRTTAGEIDASLDAQLQRLSEAVLPEGSGA